MAEKMVVPIARTTSITAKIDSAVSIKDIQGCEPPIY
jgi:hypothetical protein